MTTANLPPGAMPVSSGASDPFAMPSTPSMSGDHGTRQRYGGFDGASFSMFATGSPAQAKRALEAHIAETERRLHEASRIGQVLVSQRKELADRLKEVESAQEDEVNPALKTRLLELENEFNHVNRETARIFVGKNRAPSGEGPDRDATEYGGVAHPSPSKAHAPSRKQRNQQSSRVNDLQLATDISAELLEQVRLLQASLAEKDALLKDIIADKSHLEADLDGTRQRVKALDESEQRYKDANWALETQLHELTADHQEATSREQRLNQTLMVSTSAKASLERDFEDLKLAHAKLAEDHTAVRKQHDAELTSFKRNATQDEMQITGLHRKVEELTSQNRELAQAFAYRLGEQSRQVSTESVSGGEGILDDVETPDDSPPGSPSKATPRHGALHEETTKSALNHAYRTIQNLKNQLHREKTEKIEYRRLLQDARDDLESKRPGVDSGKKRNSKKEQEIFKKPSRPDRLGEARSSREEIILDESDDWEDHDPADTPSKRRTAVMFTNGADKRNSTIESSTDNYATATENSDAFETANEKEATATESDAFQTGNETLDGDSDLTETETGTSRGRPSKRPGHAHRLSFQSTASTSADEFDENELKTPVQSQTSKFKIRVNRGGAAQRVLGREAVVGASQSFEDSPGNVSVSSDNSTPMQGQSLANELEGLSDEDMEDGTPMSSRMLSPIASPDLRRPTPSKLRNSFTSVEQMKPVMVDSGVMTEPWEPEPKNVVANAADAITAGVAGAAGFLLGRTTGSRNDEPRVEQKSSADQRPSVVSDQQDSQRLSTASSIEPITPLLTDFPASPVHGTSAVVLPTSEPVTTTRDAPPILTPSTIFSGDTEPVELPKFIVPTVIEKPEPVERIVERFIEPPPQVLTMFSTITHQNTEPVDAPVVRPSTATKVTELATAGAGAGFLGGLLGRKKSPETTTIAEDETSQPPRTSVMQSTAIDTSTDRLPLRQIEANAPPSPERRAFKDDKPLPKVIAIETSNEATQTTLSADDLDRLLRPSVDLPPAKSPTRTALVAGTSSPRRSRELVNTQERAQRRPSSAGSHRSRDRTPPPPLPMEAKQVIAAAALTTGGKPSSSASNAAPPPPSAFGAMGPPSMPASAMGPPHVASSSMGPPGAPASAYRSSQPPAVRPQTPQTRSAQSVTLSPVRSVAINAPHPDTPSRTQVASPTRTRRSSVSSFASELDQRFNISSTAPYSGMFSDGQATDPRMIQAITNTMIGEYLYKYTRKAGSKEMSSSRHRRFFWVHPYTRTLYWSEQDPTTAGKQQLKAKSVQIEAVRIVTDDNPMPPGLHRKSLVVTTPGRTIKFTAPTSQRHETWSNALTYLLLKTGTERDAESATGEDVEEFNPGLAARSQSRNTGRSRASISSYMSRNSTRTGVSQESQHPTLRANSAQGMRSQSQNRASLSNRLSVIAGSLASRHSSKSLAHQPQVEAHNPNDSAEDLRRVIEQQERDADRLENVRACCDGKHDVASLSRTARHSRQFSAKGHTHVHSHGNAGGAAAPPNSISRASERR